MALTRRKIVAPPEPLPPRGKEAAEPETFLEKGPEVSAPTKFEPLMGFCLNCTRAAHSEVDHLCYVCHKEAEGLVYDTESKKWIKIKGKK